MSLLHLSDVHVTDPESAIAQFADGEHRLEAVVDHVVEAGVPLDAVVLTGDLVDHGTPQEYERLLAQLRRLPCPWFPLPGNHDDRGQLRLALGAHTPAPLPGDGPCNYAVDLPLAAGGEVRLVMVDSSQPESHDGRWTQPTLDWIERTLGAGPDRTTFVFTHHPPVPTGLWHMDYGGAHGGDALERVVAAHPQVELVACGHVHRRLVLRWAGTILSCAPALTYLSEALLDEDDEPTLHAGLPELPLYRLVDGRLLLDSLDWHPDRVRVPMRLALGDAWPEYEAAARSGVLPRRATGH